jgi:hypothetical protein
LAFGAWIGVRMMLMPSLRKIASKAQPNFLSRSWIRSSIRCCRSSNSISPLRACCVIHAIFGLVVHATNSIRRVAGEMKKSTYSRCIQTVSTVKKSQASVVAACWRRNDRQVVCARCGAGGRPSRANTFRTAVAEMLIPRLRSSPTIRL